MGVNCDDLVAFAHPSDDVSKPVNLDLVVTELLHLFLDPVDDTLFLATL